MIKAQTDDTWQDFVYETRQDRNTLKRILVLLRDIGRNGYEGIGKPEHFWGTCPRTEDDCNRLVYRIDRNVIRIVQCGSHYRDT